MALFNAREDYESARKLQETEVIDRHTPGQGVELDVDITGAKTLHLMADGAGDGITGDHVAWSDPRLTGPAGELRLTKQGWLSASTGWGSVAVGKDAAGGPLYIHGKPVADGIGVHADAHLAFAVPPGYTRFQAFAALDDVGVGTQMAPRFASAFSRATPPLPRPPPCACLWPISVSPARSRCAISGLTPTSPPRRARFPPRCPPTARASFASGPRTERASRSLS